MLDLLWRNLKKIYRSPNSATDGKQTREPFLGNASQLEMIFLHSWTMVQSIINLFLPLNS